MTLLGFSSFDRLCLGNKQQIEAYNVANIILYAIAINILKRYFILLKSKNVIKIPFPESGPFVLLLYDTL